MYNGSIVGLKTLFKKTNKQTNKQHKNRDSYQLGF